MEMGQVLSGLSTHYPPTRRPRAANRSQFSEGRTRALHRRRRTVALGHLNRADPRHSPSIQMFPMASVAVRHR